VIVMQWLAALSSETQRLLALALLCLVLALVLLWLRHAVKRNEKLELRVLGKHLIVVERLDNDIRPARQAKSRTLRDGE